MRKYILHTRNMIAVIIAAAALFLGIALITYNPHDPSWFYYTSNSSIITNMCGAIGAHVAALLLYLLGSASLLLIPYLFFIVYLLVRRISFIYEWDRLLAFGILMLTWATLCNMYGVDFFKSPFPGGFVGYTLRIMLYHWFDSVASGILLYTLLCVCLIILSRFFFVGGVYYLLCAVYFIGNKQRFLLPAYRTTRIIMYNSMVPVIWCGKSIYTLFNGSEVQESGQTIVEFERILFDDDTAAENDDFWDVQHQADNEKEMGEDNNVMQEEISASLKQRTIIEDEERQTVEKTYRLPSLDIFIGPEDKQHDDVLIRALERQAKILEEKLEHFGIYGAVASIKHGPVVTLFEYQPHIDAKISKIIALEDDLAMALQALSIRIIAPIPGKSVVGFEVANKKRKKVLLADVIHSREVEDFSGVLPLVLGKDTIGNNIIVDLTTMPHLLIAGSTGSGKSVALNTMLVSLLCKCAPDELRLILIDPKRLEFAAYADIAHLLFPIVTNPKQAVSVLKWVIKQMEERYEMMADANVRNVFDYNMIMHKTDRSNTLPFIVVVIDELADLMMVAGRDIEDLIARIAQMARAAGIHLIVATQRPSVDVITGLIKVNFPSRISFRVTSKIDSRVILDCNGADKLLGRGDMLFLNSATSTIERVHGAYVSDKEIEDLANHIRAEQDVAYLDVHQELPDDDDLSDADDQLYYEVRTFLKEIDEVSISLLQRKFRIGYNRSARIIDKLEAQGLVMPAQGSKARKVI